MSKRSNVKAKKSKKTSNTVVLYEDPRFDPIIADLHKEAMSLIEEIAAYSDGEGRRHCQDMDKELQSAYRLEALRLNSRTMQLAAWLFLWRARKEGDISHNQLLREKSKLNLAIASPHKNSQFWQQMPLFFQQLVLRSIDLEQRLRLVDHEFMMSLYASNNHVAQHHAMLLEQLKAAFGGS